MGVILLFSLFFSFFGHYLISWDSLNCACIIEVKGSFRGVLANLRLFNNWAPLLALRETDGRRHLHSSVFFLYCNMYLGNFKYCSITKSKAYLPTPWSDRKWLKFWLDWTDKNKCSKLRKHLLKDKSGTINK